jgi:hypothetical protein
MPRSNHPKSRRRLGGDEEELDLSRALLGQRHHESKRDGLWNVQPLSASGSTKFYTCPGCGLEIAPGVAHTVTWRADGLMGEEADLAGRRHWHVHCWKIHP